MTAPGEPAIRRDGGYDPKAVLSHAAREGLLETDKRQYRKNIRLGKNVARCIVIKPPSDLILKNNTVQEEPSR